MYGIDEWVSFILKTAKEKKLSVTNLQLQKILYFIQKEYLQNYGCLAFYERFETWPYGPVNRSVYEKYKNYGGKPIDLTNIRDNNIEFSNKFQEDDIKNLVIEKLEMNVWTLVDETHKPGGAWERTKQIKGMFQSIPNTMIQKLDI